MAKYETMLITSAALDEEASAALVGITAMCGQTVVDLWTFTTATSRTSPKNIGSVRPSFLSAPQPHGRRNSPNDKI